MHACRLLRLVFLLPLMSTSILGCANEPPTTREPTQPAKVPNYSIGTAQITGPDTLTIGGVRYRLAGIKAFPENACGAGSPTSPGGGTRVHLERMTRGRTITCHEVGRRVRGIRSAICDSKSGELNHALVTRGFARADGFGQVGRRYEAAEAHAAKLKAGLHGCT